MTNQAMLTAFTLREVLFEDVPSVVEFVCPVFISAQVTVTAGDQGCCCCVHVTSLER